MINESEALHDDKCVRCCLGRLQNSSVSKALASRGLFIVIRKRVTDSSADG